ncbi:hypothetical protein Bxe_A1809 [Paraburkholderia xenovorans LB400]|uniref:Uncharacterized protein n=1 Tax=Paraburkholderia xenovorans (strain LB400) TaxID=266265 RepID=Q13XN9_PARXL|nr:hypothetical protein Bxe_A1809 [Paraburkholderia xenovorans LB400]
MAGALWRRRFRLATWRRYRQRYRKFQSAVVSSEETVSENQLEPPLKDRNPQEIEDDFCGNTVFDTVRHVPMRSGQSLQKHATHSMAASISATKRSLSNQCSRRGLK